MKSKLYSIQFFSLPEDRLHSQSPRKRLKIHRKEIELLEKSSCTPANPHL